MDQSLCFLVSDYFNPFAPALDLKSDTWHADETFLKINGVEHYLWILIDSETRFVISFILSDKRDSSSAYMLFHQAACLTDAVPLYIVTDHWNAYNQAIATIYPSVTHYQYENLSDELSNNLIESFNHTFKAWYRTKKGLKSFDSSLALITTFIFHYNFLHLHTALNLLPPAIVAGVSYSQQQMQTWPLFKILFSLSGISLPFFSVFLFSLIHSFFISS